MYITLFYKNLRFSELQPGTVIVETLVSEGLPGILYACDRWFLNGEALLKNKRPLPSKIRPAALMCGSGTYDIRQTELPYEEFLDTLTKSIFVETLKASAEDTSYDLVAERFLLYTNYMGNGEWNLSVSGPGAITELEFEHTARHPEY